MKAPKDMTFEELKKTVDEWPPFMRPAYGWLSASDRYYKRRNRYIDELMKRYDEKLDNFNISDILMDKMP